MGQLLWIVHMTRSWMHADHCRITVYTPCCCRLLGVRACDAGQARACDSALLLQGAVHCGVQRGHHVVAEVAPQPPTAARLILCIIEGRKKLLSSRASYLPVLEPT
jgi:hypothetical protein